jgi:hypothetical protein
MGDFPVADRVLRRLHAGNAPCDATRCGRSCSPFGTRDGWPRRRGRARV